MGASKERMYQQSQPPEHHPSALVAAVDSRQPLHVLVVSRSAQPAVLAALK